MLQNYYTILKLKNELNSLIGMKLIEFFSQEKDSAILNFFDGNKENFLQFNAIPFFASLYINRSFSRAKSNTVDLCNEILGDYLQNIVAYDFERIIEFQFIKHSVIFHIFGGANSNLFVCKKNRKTIFALNNNTKFLGEKNIQTSGQTTDFLEFDENKTLLEALAKSNLLFGKIYANEFCRKNNINKNNNLLNEFSKSELLTIKENAINFGKYLIENPKVYKLKKNLSDKQDEIFFSLIPITDCEIIAEFDTVSDGLKSVVVQNFIAAKKKELLKDLLPKLNRDLKRLNDNIKIAENIGDSLERADNYRNFAELLMSQSNIKKRIGESIELTDWNGNQIKIKLDGKLTLLENATKYFTKSRKSIEEAEVKEKRLPVLKAKRDKVIEALNSINEAKNIKELEKLKNELIKKSVVIMQNEERAIETKFRVFELGEGYTIYVGKNAANNDELTMKFAKPNDIWLHARGSSGSHCVVKGGEGDGKLPKPILKAAAAIAAYYSGAKNAKYTPVCYTQKKYVHKPKGANLGAVTLQREDVIMVEPKMPE
jgi:predicted ribosome quality control (RQC) complex YloA/Tae2 family protein